MNKPSLHVPPRGRGWKRALSLLVLVAIVWAAVDLLVPRTSDLRAFDPSEVALRSGTPFTGQPRQPHTEMRAHLVIVLSFLPPVGCSWSCAHDSVQAWVK